LKDFEEENMSQTFNMFRGCA